MEDDTLQSRFATAVTGQISNRFQEGTPSFQKIRPKAYITILRKMRGYCQPTDSRRNCLNATSLRYHPHCATSEKQERGKEGLHTL